MLTVSPSVIVIGGGVMNRDILYNIVRKKTVELLQGYINSPMITGMLCGARAYLGGVTI